MRATYTITNIHGTKIDVHASLFFVLATCLVYPLFLGLPPWAILQILIAFLTMGFCVLIHELGHAAVARLFGGAPFQILFTPFGAITKFTNEDGHTITNPWVALAGPAANILMAFTTLGVAQLFDHSFASSIFKIFNTPSFDFFWIKLNNSLVEIFQASFSEKFFWLNLALGLTNLLPAFPLDGGHLAYSQLCKIIKSQDANQYMSWAGYLMGGALMIYGFQSSPIVFAIGFVQIVTARRAGINIENQILQRPPTVRDIMQEVTTLEVDHFILDKFDDAIGSRQTIFPILHQDIYVGVVTKRALAKGTGGGHASYRMEDIVDRNFPVVTADSSLELVLRLIIISEVTAVPVIDGQKFLGIVEKQSLEDRILDHEVQLTSLHERDL
jgi:CBS domain-containing protein/Zn-dependent protease